MKSVLLAFALAAMLPSSYIRGQTSVEEHVIMSRRHAVRQHVDSILTRAADIKNESLGEVIDFARRNALLGVPDITGVKPVRYVGDRKSYILIVPILREDATMYHSWSPPGHDSLYYDPDKRALFVPERMYLGDNWQLIALVSELRRAWLADNKPYDKYSVPVREAVAAEDLDVLHIQMALMEHFGDPHFLKVFSKTIDATHQESYVRGDFRFPKKSHVASLDSSLGIPGSIREWNYRQDVIFRSVGIAVMEKYVASKDPEKTKQQIRFLMAYRNHLNSEKSKARLRVIKNLETQ